MLVRVSGMIEMRSSKSRVQALYRARSGTFGNRDDRVDLIGSVNPADAGQIDFHTATLLF